MNRRSMIGKMLGGIAAFVGGGLLARASQPAGGVYGRIFPQPPINVRATRLIDTTTEMTWECAEVGRSIEGLTNSLEYYSVEMIKASQ